MIANLDQALREKYRVNLKRLLKQFKITTVYVTHDHHEALLLADMLAVMDRGRIEQVGTPQEIYDAPKNTFVAGFLNINNGPPPISLIDGRRMPQGETLAQMLVAYARGRGNVRRAAGRRTAGDHRRAYKPSPRNTTFLAIRIGEHEVHAQIEGDDSYRTGDPVWLTFKRYHVFDRPRGFGFEATTEAHPS